MTFETDLSVYHDGKWIDKSEKIIVLPDGTRLEPITLENSLLYNAVNDEIGMEFTDSNPYFSNPTIDVALVRNVSKHYLISRILKQIDDFAFNGAKLKVIPPEDESKDISEDEIDKVQTIINKLDEDVIKTIIRLRQSIYDLIIYGSSIFECIFGKYDDWKAPVIMKHLPAFSFCEIPSERMNPEKYVHGNILQGIIYDKINGQFEYWQKQSDFSKPVQIPSRNILHVRDDISDFVDGDSFVAKISPLVRKLEFADMALMETVHRSGAPILWVQIKEFRDQPIAKGQGIWSTKKALEEGKKIAKNHGKNNAIVAPDNIQPIPLDYKLPISPIEVVNSIELRILKALIPRDFLEREGNSISSSSAPALKLLTLIAEGWREKVGRVFTNLWSKILTNNGYPGWRVIIDWVDLNPEDASVKFQRAQIAYSMGNIFSEDEIREIAGFAPKSIATNPIKKNKELNDVETIENAIVNASNIPDDSEKRIKSLMDEKEKLFIEWAKDAGYLQKKSRKKKTKKVENK